jgi:ankyrin repeat protein
MVEFLLSKGADVNKGDGGWRPLHEAMHYNQKDIVRILLENGADINQEFPPVGLAAWYLPEFVEMLLDSGANVNAISSKSGFGFTPLQWALYGRNRDVFDLLLSRGADVNLGSSTGETCLHLLIRWGRGVDQVDFVLSRGADINAVDKYGWTPLHRTALHNCPEIAKLLINKGADIEVKDMDGHTPLWWAKEKNNIEIIELLRKHGAKE